MNDMYMDDYLGGAESIQAAIILRDYIIEIMKSAGFKLRKWASNCPQMLTGILNDDNDPLIVLNLDDNEIKTLGLCWNTDNGSYQFKLNAEEKTNINNTTKRASVQIHGFADAPVHAYGCCVYLRVTENNDVSCIRLIAAKSRVAPLKVIYLARLELCAAVLLCHLVEKIVNKLNLNVSKRYLWFDSTITLAWIKSSSNSWKTFVAYRVGEIQSLTAKNEWNHVRSAENPADIISRGCRPDQLCYSKIWWEGPDWLCYDEKNWPLSTTEAPPLPMEVLEQINSAMITVTTTGMEIFNLIHRYSSWMKLFRVTCYCLRWFNKTIRKKQFPSTSIDHGKLVRLLPFLDENNVLRVGGRLNKSTHISDEQRNPIRLLHAGPQALLAAVREKFWPLNGRNLARKIVHEFVVCFRSKPTVFTPIMSDLPESRVEPTRAFQVSGLDYCGPVLIKASLNRKAPKLKAYICVFVCFSTKAVHVELVSDLTSEHILTALRRFTGRWGLCTTLYSDNSTTFTGANRQLIELIKFLTSPENIEK
ncbi:uncharacterized protein LOC126909295 [Daktulosphaira vitifoliae]|uniref:uncharacterized protein LOC126909295 n=1 Tax=Daktulosphaira vitifoliae TaxID=58002 RepID=UPI0021A9D8E5|nr:uncharacterized protein LOC126909295 [Daktulosphaira vitifoliae]